MKNCLSLKLMKYFLFFLVHSGKKGGSGGLIALGAVTIGTLGALTFVKNNPDVRLTLEQWIPGTDNTIRIIFQEDNKYFDLIREFFENLKQM